MAGKTDQKLKHTHISSEHRLLDLHLGELFGYRDLILLYTRRSLVVTFKQTLLGPLWLVLGPFITSVVYMVIFGKVAGLAQDGVPQILFYLYSNAAWSFTQMIVTQNSDTFSQNAAIYGKVYFPRLAIPLSNILVALIQFAIQFVFACAFAVYYASAQGFDMTFARFPVIVLVLLEMAALGLGVGLIVSGLSNTYKDLRLAINFAVRLWMFLTPVVYPLTQIPGGALRWVMLINPATAPMECLRWCLWDKCTVPMWNIFYSAGFTCVLLFAGLVLFSRVERTFMDTV